MTPLFLDVPIIISVATFLSIFLFLMGLMGYFRQQARKRELAKKIQQDAYDWKPHSEEESPLESHSKLKARTVQFLASLGRRAESEGLPKYGRIRTRFLRAGLRGANIPAIFLGSKFLLAISLSLCFVLTRITLFKLLNVPITIAISFGLGLLGFYLPDLWLGLRTKARKRKILEGLPDALDLLVVCVEAGMGLDAAINRVGQEMELSNRILSDELKLLNLELRAGKSRKDALRNLASRTDIEDVNSLVTLLIQTDKFGTSIADALRVYSDTFRTQRYLRAEELASKMPVKLIFPLVIFIFPSIFVALLGPAAVRLYEVVLNK